MAISNSNLLPAFNKSNICPTREAWIYTISAVNVLCGVSLNALISTMTTVYKYIFSYDITYFHGVLRCTTHFIGEQTINRIPSIITSTNHGWYIEKYVTFTHNSVVWPEKFIECSEQLEIRAHTVINSAIILKKHNKQSHLGLINNPCLHKRFLYE